MSLDFCAEHCSGYLRRISRTGDGQFDQEPDPISYFTRGPENFQKFKRSLPNTAVWCAVIWQRASGVVRKRNKFSREGNHVERYSGAQGLAIFGLFWCVGFRHWSFGFQEPSGRWYVDQCLFILHLRQIERHSWSQNFSGGSFFMPHSSNASGEEAQVEAKLIYKKDGALWVESTVFDLSQCLSAEAMKVYMIAFM